MNPSDPFLTKPSITIDEIAHGSPAYDEVKQARERILRLPLGLLLSREDIVDEASQRHFVIRSNSGQILGGVIVKPGSPGRAQLRQMWVEEEAQGRGLGAELLLDVIARLSEEGISTVILHARKPVLGFYERCGFRVDGEEFEEVGIPHRRMILSINPGTQSPGDHR